MADPIREALKRLLAVIKPKYTDPDEIVAVVRAMAAARTALAAEPPAPAEPDTDAVLILAAIIRKVDGNNSLGAAALAEAILAHPNAASVFQPPAPAPTADGERDHVPGAGNMVPAAYAARLRQCHTHGQLPANAWGCPECLRELREELARLRAPAADGEREELASALEVTGSCEIPSYKQLRRAAALLRQPAPAPVPVAERPWKRPGWCDAQGRCWWFNRVGIPEWQLADGGPYGDFCLPHWAIAIPQPPQANTTHPTPTEPPND